MAFGIKRRRRKKVGGLVGAQARRDKREKLLAKQQEELEKFKTRYPKFGEVLDDIRSNAAEGYQIPKTDYDVSDHLAEVFELALQAGDQRKVMLAELDAIFARRSGSNKYLALLKAASVPGYSEKELSKNAKKVRGAIKEGIELDSFEDYRKNFGKPKKGIRPKRKT